MTKRLFLTGSTLSRLRNASMALSITGEAPAAELRVLEQVHALDHAAGEGPALEQLVLRLVVVVARRVDLGDFLEGEDVRRVALDQDLGGALIDGSREQRAQRGEGGHSEEDGKDQAAAPENDVDIFPEVRVLGLAFRTGRRDRGHGPTKIRKKCVSVKSQSDIN